MWNLLSRQQGWPRLIGIVAGCCLIGAQASEPSAASLNETSTATVELPLLSGWYDGDVVFYITTDVSQEEMARAARANYVPRMRHALRAPEPGQPTAVDRVYKFTNFAQGSVFPSVPQPRGSADADAEYTPIWVVYQVTWLPGSAPHLLRSEQEIADAEEKKLVRIAATDVVVDCPILFSRKSGPPDGMKIHVLNR